MDLRSYLSDVRREEGITLSALAEKIVELGSKKALSAEWVSRWLRDTGTGIPMDEFERVLEALGVSLEDAIRRMSKADLARYVAFMLDGAGADRARLAMLAALCLTEDELTDALRAAGSRPPSDLSRREEP